MDKKLIQGLYKEYDSKSDSILDKYGDKDGFVIDGKLWWDYYKELDCHQCASIFTIEKSLFYTFDIKTILQYISGYQFLRKGIPTNQQQR